MENKIEEKEKSEKMSEEKALQMLNGLLKKAMKFNEYRVVEELGLSCILKDIPRVLENSKRIERARSEIYSKKFKDNVLNPFLIKLVLGLSELTERYRQVRGTNAYLDIRGDVADFLVREGSWGECMETYYQLDFLFESYPKIIEGDLGHPHDYKSIIKIIEGDLDHPHDYKSIIIALIASLMMFNCIMARSE